MKALFSGADFHRVGESQRKALRDEIDQFTEDYLASTSESKLIEYLIDKYSLEPPTIGEPYIEDSRETKVDVRSDWRRHILDRSKPFYVTGNRIEVRLPFSGDSQFFRITPSSRSWNPPVVEEIWNDYLAFAFEGVELKPEEIRRSISSSVEEITKHLQTLKSDCDSFNGTLNETIRQMLVVRRQRYSASRNIVEGIGLPIKQREGAPRTYAAPDVRRKPKIERPVAVEKAVTSEPELAQQEFEHILAVIQSMVHVIEQSPKAFLNMQEEDFRTHFLVQLNGQYEGRASGETFNYQGKTDILIREGDRNVFIAECAFWKGEAYLTAKIDQILSYLHWRDTKTALIVFNRNKFFSEVLSKVEPTVTSHRCCKKLLNKASDTEWRFLFRNADDPNRELQLAVMLFDVPKVAA